MNQTTIHRNVCICRNIEIRTTMSKKWHELPKDFEPYFVPGRHYPVLIDDTALLKEKFLEYYMDLKIPHYCFARQVLTNILLLHLRKICQ